MSRAEWVKIKEKTHYLYEGKYYKSSDMEKRTNIPSQILYYRVVKKGMTVEQAISIPVKRHKNRPRNQKCGRTKWSDCFECPWPDCINSGASIKGDVPDGRGKNALTSDDFGTGGISYFEHQFPVEI